MVGDRRQRHGRHNGGYILVRVTVYLARKRQRDRQNVINTARLSTLLRDNVIRPDYSPANRRKTTVDNNKE